MQKPLAALALVLAAAVPTRAADVRVDGAYRLRLDLGSDFALDDTGQRLGQTAWLEHRLRLTPTFTEGDALEIQGSFDVVSGLLAGDLAPGFRGLGWTERSERNGAKARGFDFRSLFGQLDTSFGRIALGQMPSHWGMGLVVNGGEGENEADFGEPRFGDLVDRAAFTTHPLTFLGPRSDLARDVSLLLAADYVYRDRWASLLVRNGTGIEWADTAIELVSEAVWQPSDRMRAGLRIARRTQSYRSDGGNLHTWSFDGHLRTAATVDGLGGALATLEAEAVQIVGATTHVLPSSGGRTRIDQRGGALRLGLARGAGELGLEAGYASGDSDPFDDRSTELRLSRDYKVGLVLFDQVLLFQTQNAAARFADPSNLSRPPPGLDLIPTEGAVANALYLQPVVRWKPRAFRGLFRFVGSALFARAPAKVIDAWQAFATSSPRNAFGHAAGHDYGVEVDGAILFDQKLSRGFGLEAGFEAGWLFPGDAFLRADGTRMPGVGASRLRATLTF